MNIYTVTTYWRPVGVSSNHINAQYLHATRKGAEDHARRMGYTPVDGPEKVKDVNKEAEIGKVEVPP